MKIKTKHWNSLVANKDIKIYYDMNRIVVNNGKITSVFNTQDIGVPCGTIIEVEPHLVYKEVTYIAINHNLLINERIIKEIICK